MDTVEVTNGHILHTSAHKGLAPNVYSTIPKCFSIMCCFKFDFQSVFRLSVVSACHLQSSNIFNNIYNIIFPCILLLYTNIHNNKLFCPTPVVRLHKDDCYELSHAIA
jgi:hypothetical protein